jgi:signal peptidase I
MSPVDQSQVPQASTPANEFVEIVKTVVYALLIALVLRVFLFQPFTIPSASMEPNLLEGDYIIVSKYSYGYSRHSIPMSPPLFSGRIMDAAPKRGDIVVFKLPRDGHTDYIKRLIGLPGDRVQIKQSVIYINDKPLPRVGEGKVVLDMGGGFGQPAERFKETNPEGRDYATYSFGTEGDAENTGVYVVPQGQYFMMGDNRDNSLDSRFPEEIGVGFVPSENLVGRARIILLSWNRGVSLFKPWTWFTEARLSRFGHVLK